MNKTAAAFWHNFLGHAPRWYKLTIIGFLVANPILLLVAGPTVAGWVLVLEFIFTLAMALTCYPLQPGGLLALEATVLGMTSTELIAKEVFNNFPVILLLMFMVAGIFFMKELLLFAFTKILLGIRSKTLLAFLFTAASAFLSAFLDALTVMAVIISVAAGFYAVYHKVATDKTFGEDAYDQDDDSQVVQQHRRDLDQFRAFLRTLLMHGAVGTALGGVCTTVGEPQNLLIANRLDWTFVEFFVRMSPVTMPVLAVGLVCCILLEKTKIAGYGVEMPLAVRDVLRRYEDAENARRTQRDAARLFIQAAAGVMLVVALAFHVAEVGLIGLMVIVVQTAFNGIIKEHQLGKAFEEALPFTSLLVVFFAIVAVIESQHLFEPILTYVLSLDLSVQPGVFYIANGLLSAISDNVFVATVYINQVHAAYEAGNISREHFDLLAVAINTGTNIPSIATPNGQAAFLFLLTSSVAPLVRLSYLRMVIMALPYTLLLGLTGWAAVHFLLA